MKKTAVLLLILITGLFFGVETRAASSKDSEYEKAIVGDWSEGPGTGVASFKSGGGYFASLDQKNGRPPCTLEGVWWIKDGILYNRLDKMAFSCPPFGKLGDIVTDMIVSITRDKKILISEDGRLYIRTRVR